MPDRDSNDPADSTAKLQLEVKSRKAWFFECQLRRLTLEAFRDVEVNERDFDSLLNVISKPLTPVPGGQVGSSMKAPAYVYLDNEQPVWTHEERDRRQEFAGTFIGRAANWLDYQAPVRLIENLARLKGLYEANQSRSSMHDAPALRELERESASLELDPPKDRNQLAHAISRVAITEQAAWLIPEIFDGPQHDTSNIKNWVANGEAFVNDYEVELKAVLGGRAIDAFDLEKPEKYRLSIREALKDSLAVQGSGAIKVQFLDTSNEPWRFEIKIQTAPSDTPPKALKDYRASQAVRYWIDASVNSIEEIFINKADSDMGLCLSLRALYLYGTLPSNFAAGKKPAWRDRKAPSPQFNEFFSEKAKLIQNDAALQDLLRVVQTKLQILLEETANSPNSGAIHFSPLAQEIWKQSILAYKFWLDEPFSAFDNAGNPGNEQLLSFFNKARKAIGAARKAVGRDDVEAFEEKEYWSENHYIMFASCEYLAGQLWEGESFLPGKDFLVPQVYWASAPSGVVPVKFVDESTPVDGSRRRERGKARTLKWLNNRLMFGWAEFHSSGYYREHLMALLNLVDFSMDEEVKKKAEIVTDLLLFDLIRFSHKGSMGAAGGRSQFKSKCAGWDNALGDVLEIILGSRGAFVERSGDIGCSFATSTYEIPDVLLEIGRHPPDSVVDRSRVSITFDEASKYGIQYSKKSDQKRSVEQGFASKRTKYYEFIKENNDEIARTHFGYGAKQDDTVFWWTLSAYFNKEVVKNTLELIQAFGLRKTGVFNQLFDLVKYVVPFVEKTSRGFIGAAIGGVTGAGAATLAGAALGFFADDIFDYSVIEEGSSDLSFFLEGSTRTRANIFTYRNRDIMLSSVQNWRAGQFNFQSNVNQATLNGAVNVFTTAAFSGLDLSSFETSFLGGVVGGALSGGFAGALLGAYAGLAANELLVEGKEVLATHGDGPGWWTGYWALPMVVQHEGAAIIAYDFNKAQRKLAKVGSHVWFPKDGFTRTDEARSSAYEDDNFFLLDIADIGPEGFWLFGQMVHKSNPLDPDANEEGYIGVFSNQRPHWLTQDSDFYKDKISVLTTKALEAQFKDPKPSRQLDDFPDYFANKDWYASGKNVWIIQVGNKSDFGSYDNFRDRVSKAKVVLDDAGDMQCSYAIPKKDGSSQTLSLDYGDGGKFSLEGKPFGTDLYPRFENKFIRGDLVEWGQREYLIEHRGKSLLHDFSVMKAPLRVENAEPHPDSADSVKALVIYLRTEDEEMEKFTVATATVRFGCDEVAVGEVIAAGAVDVNTSHDAEWIFFDRPGQLRPDMTLELEHPPSSDGNDEPEWSLSFSLKALMGDLRLRDCSVSFPGCHFSDGRRSTGPIPFTVRVSRWRPWQLLDDRGFRSLLAPVRPGWEEHYYDYSELLGIDGDRRLWHRRVEACPGSNSEWKAVGTTGRSLLFDDSLSVCSVSNQPGELFVFAANGAELFHLHAGNGENVTAKPWVELKPATIPTILGLPIPNAAWLPVPLSPQTRIFAELAGDSRRGIDLYLSGADDSFYSRAGWLPDDGAAWRQIDTDSTFKPLAGAQFEVCRRHLFALDDRRRLWVGAIDDSDVKCVPAWQRLTDDHTEISSFAVARTGPWAVILVATLRGEVRAASFSSVDSPLVWERVGEAIDFIALVGARLAWAAPWAGHLDIFTTGSDGQIYTTYWEAQAGWQKDHDWMSIDPNGHHIASRGDGLLALSRVNGQVEVFASANDGKIWTTWWT